LNRRKRPALLPPPAGVFDYWAIVHVELHQPISSSPPGESPAVGYYRNIGFRCTPDRIHQVLIAAISDGTLDWPDTEVSETDPAMLDRDIRARIFPVAEEGTWYLSGKAFHGHDGAEEPPN